MAESVAQQLAESKIFSQQLAKKPAQRGTIGREIKLYANHYKIGVKPFTVHQYDLSIERVGAVPDPKREKDLDLKNKEFVKLMFDYFINKCVPPNYKDRVVYNYSKNIYSLEPLPFQDSKTYEVTVERQKYNLTITKINQITVDVSKCLDPEILMVLEIIMSHRFSLLFHTLGRSYFQPRNKEIHDLGFGVQLWKGAFASVRPSESGLTWNIDSANAAFLAAEDVLDLAMKHYDCRDSNQLKNAIVNDKDGGQIGASFVYAYRGREIKVKPTSFRKKIQGLGYASTHKFDWKKSDDTTVNITIKDYFKQQYNITIKYPDLPCIHIGKEAYVPMELCSTEVKNKKKLTDQETRDMIKHTAVRANDRMNHIKKWVESSEVAKDPILQAYNISLDLRMIQLDGRVIPGPDIQYGNQQTVKSKEIAEKGSWNHQKLFFMNPMRIDNWVVVNFAGPRAKNLIDPFIDALVDVGKTHGMILRDAADVLDYNPMRKTESQLMYDIGQMMNNLNNKYKPLHLFVCIFSDKDQAYRVVKTCGDIQVGVVTQCVVSKNVARVSDQLVSNILLKINTKLGGRNFTLVQQNKL